MRISSDNTYKLSTTGLYFTKAPNVILNSSPKINYITKGTVKKSELGYRYIEDNETSQGIKDKFHFIPFTRELAAKTDTFIFFREVSPNHPNNITDTFFSFARIIWLNHKTGMKQCTTVSGNSNISNEDATQKMFENLLHKDFHELKIMY